MWTCPKCGRIFGREGQQHSCRKVPLEEHFEHKEKARELFDYLVTVIEKKIGPCRMISLPCCVHLFGVYDFLAVLPKKDGLEVRLALGRELESSRLKVCVPMSKKVFKNCFEIREKEEFDKELIGWLKEAYFLKS